jgi:glyoxylase-like metal-dependent hydrolase (beta-lactamase superfamily II)
MVEKEPLTIHFNGEDILVVPLPSHSSSDVVVFFESSQVLHMGDDYFPRASGFLFPGPSMNDYFAAFDPIVGRLSDDAWVVVGHEAPVRGRDLKASYAATKEMRDFVRQQISTQQDLAANQRNGSEKGYRAGWMKYFYEQIAPK